MPTERGKTPDPYRTFFIASAAGSSGVDPNVITVKLEDGKSIYWTVTQGIARISFKDPDAVQFKQDFASSAGPAEAVPLKKGIHNHLIAVWIDNEAPHAVRAVLIVE